MWWRHVVVEGFCFAEQDPPPCHRHTVSPFCLGTQGPCPYFAYAVSDEREAAAFVPLHVLIGDRGKVWSQWLWEWLRWQLWDRWDTKYQSPSLDCSPSAAEVKRVGTEAEFAAWFAQARDKAKGEK